jgi:hypothetical protein
MRYKYVKFHRMFHGNKFWASKFCSENNKPVIFQYQVTEIMKT